ncbi:MAG: histidine kinase [Bacteroidota bacterium]
MDVHGQEKSKGSGEKTVNETYVGPAGDQVIESLKNNDERELAESYEALAKKFRDNGNYKKAEEYFKKALASFKKINSKDDISRVARSLAKVKEKQQKTREAVYYYKTASAASSNGKAEQKINFTDANRLNSSSNSSLQTQQVSSNITLLKKSGDKADLQDAYQQKADICLFQNDVYGAIDIYYQAIEAAKDDESVIAVLKGKIADAYKLAGDYDSALTFRNALAGEAKRNGDDKLYLEQQQQLAAIFFATGNTEKALDLLRTSYKLAFEKGYSQEVKKCLSRLVEYYKGTGNYAESIVLYERFLDHLDELILADSSLIDLNSFQVIEGKIKQLEKEKVLKDELISSANNFNYVLSGSLLVLLILLGLFIRSLLSIKTRNKKIALQSLRREMNPHFIFNSLNSVNQFISQNNELEANKYLTSYSKLMRNIMENSSKDFIPLGKEVELLKKYLDLEQMRFKDKFEYTVSVDERLDLEALYVPNMLIQPNLENAIWHGLRYLDTMGLLQLTIALQNDRITVTIDDNGIGLKKSNELKTSNQKAHDSLGLKNTEQRIELLNKLYRTNISFSIREKAASEAGGTVVELVFPLIDKPVG